MDETGSSHTPRFATIPVSRAVLSEKDHVEFVTYVAGLILGSITKVDPSNGLASLNELRVLNRIFMRDYIKNRPVTATELSNDLRLALSTVSKFTAKNIADGVIWEERDRIDRRRKLLRFTQEAIVTTLEWADAVNKGREKAFAKGFPVGALYEVDPTTRSNR